MFKTILVPTDGSRLSQKAAALLARETGAKLVALHVYPRFSGSPYGNYGPSEDIIEEAHAKQHAANAERLFAGARKLANSAGVGVDTALVQGNNIHKEIIAVARKKKCDLICMASHGRHGLSGI